MLPTMGRQSGYRRATVGFVFQNENNVFGVLLLILLERGGGGAEKKLFWNLQEAERPSVGAWDKVEPVYSVPNKVVE